MPDHDHNPLITPGFFIALMAALLFFLWFATKLMDDRWEYCKQVSHGNKWRQEKCYIEGFSYHAKTPKN